MLGSSSMGLASLARKAKTDPYQMNGGLSAGDIAAIDSGNALSGVGGDASKVASDTPGLASDFDWGNAALLGVALALGGNNNHKVTTSRSTSTLGPSASSSWSPATESLLKMLNSMQSGWTKYGSVK